jgi:PAS domain S-box-containing protein
VAEVTGAGSVPARDRGATAGKSFMAAGRRFTVVVPRESIRGAAAVLPWVILAGGLLVLVLVAALGLNAARRARAQEELDRIFTLSQDVIAVADFDGRFKRLNPAAEEILGYSEEELLTRPYLDLVYPADRDSTAAEADALAQGKPTVSFENRYLRKDGSFRILEWTVTPDVGNRLMYAVARDVTDRRSAEAEVKRLADEQAALRRVATLVAQGVAPGAVFGAVTGQVAELLGASAVTLARYDADRLTVVAQRGVAYVRVGERFPLGGANVTSTVTREQRTGRLVDFADATGEIGVLARRAGVQSMVSAPVVVEGRTWGVLVALWQDRDEVPDDAEQRLARFAELLDTAIANADSRDQLTASRARMLAAGDDARRRLVRDLHDGAQQRLVHTTLSLKLAQRALRENPTEAEARVAEALSAAERATAELRELAHGILPSVLIRGGLHAGVHALASRVDVIVDVDVSEERLHRDIEASAYFIIAEALTNVVKHAHATHAEVTASVEDELLHITVRDDGIGGADPAGHGLVGIADRVMALGGWLEIDSPAGRGTLLTARLPLSTGPGAQQ